MSAALGGTGRYIMYTCISSSTCRVAEETAAVAAIVSRKWNGWEKLKLIESTPGGVSDEGL